MTETLDLMAALRQSLQRFSIRLCRANGRIVKEEFRPSHYSAKLLKAEWEKKYDPTYYVEINPVNKDNPTKCPYCQKSNCFNARCLR